MASLAAVSIVMASPQCTRVPIGSPVTTRRMFPPRGESNTTIGQLVLHRRARRRSRPSPRSPRGGNRRTRAESSRSADRIELRVGRVDAVDLRSLEQRVGMHLERALGGAGVGGEVRDARARPRRSRRGPSRGGDARAAERNGSATCAHRRSPSARRVATWIFSSASCSARAFITVASMPM